MIRCLLCIVSKGFRSKMDRKSWPWKKKSSEKSGAEKAIATLDSAGGSLPSAGSQADKDNHKKANYVQISVESYTHLTGLENQVKTYEEQAKAYDDQAKAYEDQVQTLEEEINELNEKLSSANSEIITKEELVKQHAKVAEEAVSGWEKAEEEALTLKNHLESVTLAKLTVEDKAAHLDGALKECMRQIRNLKEENEQKLQDVALNKNKQYDRMKHELETKIACLDQDLMRAEAESVALSRSLQERSNMLIKVSEEKSRAEAEIELLKSNVESCEREINSLKYELHIVSKEMEIRNEEKNMSVKSAEVANKQQMESVKKIAKLEAECQRLRNLVRKKLPGPAALAQMKLEVESLGRDHGDTRLRRSPMRPPSPQYSSNPHMLAIPELSLDGSHKFQKENEYLTERLFAMEEETKMLKEALAKRNSELQTSRSICAKTASKLQSLEAQVQGLGLQKGFPKVDIHDQLEKSFSQHASHAPSMTSLSEDGNDDAVSCAESWAKSMHSENGSHLELMDDFEEMEKLARNGSFSGADTSPSSQTTAVSRVVVNDVNNTSMPPTDTKPDCEPLPLVKLQSRISRIFDSVSNEPDVMKILEDIKHVVQEVQVNLHPQSINCIFEEKHCSDGTAHPQDVQGEKKEICLSRNDGRTGKNGKIGPELVDALSQIHNFILSLGKEAREIHVLSNDCDGLSHKIEQFSAIFNRALAKDITLDDFVFGLSDVMTKATELRFDFLGYKVNEAEVNSPACIDKVALPENKPPQGESYCNGCGHISDSSSNPEVPPEANILSGFEPGSCKCTVEEFEQLKAEKDNLEREFFKCSQDLELARSELKEMEQQLSEVKSDLTSSKNTNSLAETQLKCMAESYKTLEKRADKLEDEVKVLQEKMESLNDELETERMNGQDALARCKDLEEQLQRNEECSVCSSAAAEVDTKAKQEMELEAASEKLAACQETIFLLGKQLKSMRPQPEFMDSPDREKNPITESLNDDGPTTSGMDLQDMDRDGTSPISLRSGSDSPLNFYNGPFSPSNAGGNVPRSPISPKNPRHRPTKSGSSTTTAASATTPAKNSRGFTRFFKSKGRNTD
ncbi:filament-like plant protein 4 isoform X2 [Silene latifolia]|uniref:filament-like plant protein 4 isoform X2 n=1 Tax=Silene latifolia TaxID=37657 RepID=UPI003D789C14